MNEKKVLFEEAAPPDAYIPPLYVQSEFNLRETELEHIPLSPLVHSDPALVPQPTSSATLECPEIENNSATPTAPPSHENVTDAPDNRKSSEPASAGMRNQSEFEINREHKLNQQRYRQYNTNSRKRRLTDIDFEGILKIIGGCNMWQVIIYLMISAHQVPHAMFALSVVYMMYPPDHWCKIPGFNKEVMENSNGNIELGWTWEKALNSGIAYPLIQNKQRRNQMMHDQCNYYVEEKEGPYASFLKENFNSTSFAFKTEPNRTLARCREWDYDRSIMKETVVTQWHRVCDDNWSRAHVHLSYSLGYLLGCIVGGYVSDTYGRKPAIYGFSILSTVFGFLLPFSREFEVFLVVRFLLATCNEAADLAAYVMCMEITGTKYRSIVGCLLQAPWACGYAFLALVAYLCKSWVTIQLITCFLHFCALIFIHHLPESPRWLIVTNRVDEAEKIIRKACQRNNSSLPSDLGLVRHAEMRKWNKQKERPHFLHSFKLPDMTFRNTIIFTVWIATALVYYGIVLFQSTPEMSMFGGNFFLNNAIAGAIELPTLMGVVFLMQFGRKRSQMLTLISAGTLIFIAMVSSWMDHMTLSLIFMLLGKVCIQGAFTILYIFTSELYPTVIRNSAVGTCSMVARMGSGASGYIAILSDVTVLQVPMAIFCIFSLIAGVLVTFLPETRDLPLPDTMWDAVNMLRTDKTFHCVGGGGDPEKDANKNLVNEENLDE